VGVGIGGDVWNAPRTADAGHAILVGGPVEETAEAAPGSLKAGVWAAVREAPGGLAGPGPGRMARLEGGAPDAENERVGSDEDGFLSRREAAADAAGEGGDERARLPGPPDGKLAFDEQVAATQSAVALVGPPDVLFTCDEQAVAMSRESAVAVAMRTLVREIMASP
jgi:hypothetical protein